MNINDNESIKEQINKIPVGTSLNYSSNSECNEKNKIELGMKNQFYKNKMIINSDIKCENEDKKIDDFLGKKLEIIIFIITKK